MVLCSLHNIHKKRYREGGEKIITDTSKGHQKTGRNQKKDWEIIEHRFENRNEMNGKRRMSIADS